MRRLAVLLVCVIMIGACTSPTAAVLQPTAAAVREPDTDVTRVPHAGLVAITYYVRPDGGSVQQCSGLVDAPYPGSGAGQACAWDHPFRALPPYGEPRIAGGDTLIIGAGQYRMGHGAPGADDCDPDATWDCHMPPVPSGPDPARPTRILGVGWDSNCPNAPTLWGTQRVNLLVNLTDSDNVELACLEITDRSSCVESHAHGVGGSDLTCERDRYPYGDWASDGIYAVDSVNVWLHDLDIHGLASAGIRAGRLEDWTLDRVRIAGNGWVGWEGDLSEPSSNSGVLIFRGVTIEWNGCGETYPGEEPVGCWGQDAGGYGDGLGTADTGGDWVFEDCQILHNTSDGLDLLYHSLGGTVTIDRMRAEGNAGNQVKVAGAAVITNSVLVGNCTYFEGQPFTYEVPPESCRALGSALLLSYTGGEAARIVNSTIYGQGDGLVGGGPRERGSCNGAETLTVRNTIFRGDADSTSPGDITFLFYQEGCADLFLDSDHNLFYSAKNVTCGADETYVHSGTGDLCLDPVLTGPLSGDSYGMIPAAGSPAIDAGDDALCPTVDIRGFSRPVDGDGDGAAACDMGAYEVLGTASHMATRLPLVVNGAKTPQQVPLLAVNDFLYQLQDYDLTAIGNAAYDLVIMDYSAEGDDATAFTAGQINALRRSPGGDKILLAYLSIGEAEDYRFYWQEGWVPGNPAWLDAPNPDWAGNYKVHYWQPEWQAIIFSYLDRLLDAGFDGVYLDMLDAYEYYADRGRNTAAQEMADFVGAIAAYARAHTPSFIIMVQNAPELAQMTPAYLESVDGIGQEDIYYGYEGDDVATPAAVTEWLETRLDGFRDAGKLVLTIDYATTPAHIDAAYARSLARGFVPFVTVRDLDQLTINAGHAPD